MKKHTHSVTLALFCRPSGEGDEWLKMAIRRRPLTSKARTAMEAATLVLYDEVGGLVHQPEIDVHNGKMSFSTLRDNWGVRYKAPCGDRPKRVLPGPPPSKFDKRVDTKMQAIEKKVQQQEEMAPRAQALSSCVSLHVLRLHSHAHLHISLRVAFVGCT